MARRTSPAPPRDHTPDLPGDLAPRTGLGAHADVLGARLTLPEGDVDGSHARLAEVRVEPASVAQLGLNGAVLSDVAVAELRAVSLLGREGVWRNVVVEGGRIATLDAVRASWNGVTLRGLRVDYLSLPSSEVTDLLVEGCSIGTLDVPEARLHRVRFVDCRADEVDTRGLRAADLDLRGLEALAYTDVRGLAGATLDARQAELHAPAFAAALQIRILG